MFWIGLIVGIILTCVAIFAYFLWLDNQCYESIEDIEEIKDQGDYHWIGAFTDYDGCVEICESEVKDGYLLGYRIVEKEGFCHVYYKHNPDYK